MKGLDQLAFGAGVAIAAAGMGFLLRARHLHDRHGLAPARVKLLRREGGLAPEQEEIVARTRRLVTVGVALNAGGWLVVVAVLVVAALT